MSINVCRRTREEESRRQVATLAIWGSRRAAYRTQRSDMTTTILLRAAGSVPSCSSRTIAGKLCLAKASS